MQNRTELTRSSYSVKLTIPQFIAVDRRDNKAKYEHQQLNYILEKAGCIDVEYNGHFGAYIYYSLDRKDDTLELREDIEKAIIMYADRRPIDVVKKKLGLEA